MTLEDSNDPRSFYDREWRKPFDSATRTKRESLFTSLLSRAFQFFFFFIRYIKSISSLLRPEYIDYNFLTYRTRFFRMVCLKYIIYLCLLYCAYLYVD